VKVGPQRAERLGAGAVRVCLDDQGVLGHLGVKADAADDCCVGDLGAVLVVLDGGVQKVPQERQAQAEQQAEHHAQGQVGGLLGAHRGGGHGRGAHDGHLDPARLALVDALQLGDGLGELLADGAGDRSGHLRVGAQPLSDNP
jgi:hypothetical protein